MSIFIALYLLPPLHLFLYVTATTDYLLPYSPTDLILLNCGASSNLSSPDGRGWDGDSQSKFAASNPPEASSVFAASKQDPSVNQVPYMTARIFHSKFTYTFPVLPGPKFVRLYFYPASYSNLDISTSYFSIRANNYQLLNNFSASLTVSAIIPPVDYFTKEFIITVRDNQKLELTFIPSPASFSFINGIEIVSMPDSLYACGNDNPLTCVGNDLFFYPGNTTALETVYRLNVGGKDISSTGDTGMYRTWHQDFEYLLGQTGNTPYLPGVKIKYTTKTPAYSAPAMVYSTMRSMGPEPRLNLNYNLTWIFPVDAGFHYLLRLHFCETRMEVKNENQQVFLIFINNQTAEYDADVIHMSGGNGIPVYKDYIVQVPQGSQSKQDLWLELHPNMELKPTYADAILNGLEIFKLNTTDGNLAGFNPEPTVAPPPAEQHPSLQDRRTGKRSSILTVIGIVGGSIGAVFACSLILCFFAFKQKRVKDPSKSEEKSSSTLIPQTSRSTTSISPSLPTDLCRRFTFFEINEATGNFDDQNIIGSGGFGTVYKGYIEYGFIAVAIKRLDSSSKQGTREFQTEIEMLSNLRHLHLVPPVIPSSPKEQASLAEWVRRCYQRGTLDQIVDPHLKGEVAPVSLNKFAEIANSCLHGQGIERPKMGDVVWGLEFALQLQQTAEKNANSVDGINMENKSSLSPHQDVMTTDDDDMFSGAESHSRSTVSTRESVTQSDPDQRARGVFSEIIDPKAR
ncbi:hypothetical protein H0E87_028069 [Populus deltoides]|uniref:Protein kinase domain-containing protein n=1 Tax=Populus deltoides TaxID=3696 RepID=A0A8T2WSY9_POPDE|nr:hypothetical protein H0E87_028069 [Populus deltoides]